MAERLAKFHQETPPRFRTKRREVPASREPVMSPQLTKPKTPKLIAKSRTRPVTVESAAEKEDKEVKEVERYE